MLGNMEIKSIISSDPWYATIIFDDDSKFYYCSLGDLLTSDKEGKVNLTLDQLRYLTEALKDYIPKSEEDNLNILSDINNLIRSRINQFERELNKSIIKLEPECVNYDQQEYEELMDIDNNELQEQIDNLQQSIIRFGLIDKDEKCVKELFGKIKGILETYKYDE